MMRLVLLIALFTFGCVASGEKPSGAPPRAPKPGDVNAQVCQCTDQNNCDDFGDHDSDCVCSEDDNCQGTQNCDQADADSDGIGDACDEIPGTATSIIADVAALDARLDALEAAGTGTAITALQYDVAALAAALAEIRTKYPSHYHGLLGLNGDPVGSSGDLNYELPGDP